MSRFDSMGRQDRCVAHVVLAFVCGLTLLLGGCGGSKSLPVRGKVVFADGLPVENGKVEFRGIGNDTRAMGDLDPDGRFSLRTLEGGDGVPEGTYDVIVLQIIITEDLGKLAHGHGRPVPPKYGDYFTSGLKVEVTPENANAILITLAE